MNSNCRWAVWSLFAALGACGVSGCGDDGTLDQPGVTVGVARAARGTGGVREHRMSEAELADLVEICSAVSTCIQQHCDREAEKVVYRGIEVETKWGEEMRNTFARRGTAYMGPHFLLLLREDDLVWWHPTCRAVAYHYGG